MARPLRIEFPGAIYHVTGRMIGSWRDRRERLFRDERDYRRFLERLAQGVSEFGIRLYLFYLMRGKGKRMWVGRFNPRPASGVWP